jgi:hypothetical protein
VRKNVTFPVSVLGVLPYNDVIILSDPAHAEELGLFNLLK